MVVLVLSFIHGTGREQSSLAAREQSSLENYNFIKAPFVNSEPVVNSEPEPEPDVSLSIISYLSKNVKNDSISTLIYVENIIPPESDAFIEINRVLTRDGVFYGKNGIIYTKNFPTCYAI